MTFDNEELNEPPRFGDHATGMLGQAVRATRRVAAAPETKQRLYRRAGWLTVIGLASSYSAAAAAAVGGTKVLSVITALGVGAAAVGTYALVTSGSAPIAPSASQGAEVVQESAPTRSESAAKDVVLPPVQHTEPSVLPAAERPVPKASSTSDRKPGTQPLSHEIKLIDDAEASLKAGHAEQALGSLRDYRVRFPGGRFSLEAAALEIQALAAAGRTDEARRRAETFIATHPNSLLVERVRPYASP